jgi:sigma-B regulation protein RsbU (phosphoserine phosphatase)
VATTSIKAQPLRLSVVAGPAMETIEVAPDKPVVLGRAGIADVRLLDETVSRRHTQVALRADSWLVTDLESRHGTTLNGVQLAPNAPAPLQHGDLIRIGPWIFRVLLQGGGPTTSIVATTDDAGTSISRVQKVPESELAIRAQERLDLLIEAAANIAGADSEAALADTVLDVLVRATSFPRAAFIKRVGDSDAVELIGYKGVDNPGGTPVPGAAGATTAKQTEGGFPTTFGRQSPAAKAFSPSRSLIRAASEGQVVRIDAGSSANYGQSIIDMGIHSAICAPVMVGAVPAAFLYLDSRGSEDAIAPDSAAFCQALSKICGLSMAKISALALADRQKKLESDLQAARDAQSLIMPVPSATVGAFTYAMHNVPGRIVAGDLFDVIAMEPGNPRGKVAVLLGDVAGKGVGAALRMATAQAFINAMLQHTTDAAAVINATNKHMSARCDPGQFISLWFGVFEPQDGGSCKITIVDAGHGYWLLKPPGGEPKRIETTGGVPIGVDGDYEYPSETVEVPSGSRVVLYSDGVHEQPSPAGDEFGLDRTVAALSSSNNPEEDVVNLIQSVKAHAAPQLVAQAAAGPFSTGPEVALADDVTVASVLIG